MELLFILLINLGQLDLLQIHLLWIVLPTTTNLSPFKTYSMIEITRVKYDHLSLYYGDTFKEIVKACCEHFGVSEEKLRGNKRLKPIVMARQIAQFLIVTNISHVSLTSVGRWFNRHHSSILHSREEIKFQISVEGSDYQLAYDEIVSKLPFEVKKLKYEKRKYAKL